MIENTSQNRYELEVDGHIVYATFTRKDGTLIIHYVEAPPILRGTGAAGKLMQEIMETAKKENLKVIPLCTYAATWIARNKEYEGMVEKS